MTVTERKKQLKRRKTVALIILLGLIILCGCKCYQDSMKSAEMMEVKEDVLRFRMEDVEVDIRNLGEYQITAYCACDECTDGDGLTALNKPPVEGRTVAVDPSVIPFGTVLVINDHEYIAEDSGVGWIEGKELDIFFESHEEADEFGVQWADVYVKED